MAEDNNDIIEEATEERPQQAEKPERDNDSEEKKEKDKPKLLGLSTSLLIKIGIGLAALSLIAGLAIFFLMDSDDDAAEDADPMLIEDSDTAPEADATDASEENTEAEAALPPVDIDMESDEEESVTLPTVVKKQTDENGNVIPTDNLIDPMAGIEDATPETAISSNQPATIDPANNSPASSTSSTNNTEVTKASADAGSSDKLLKEVMALQQQLNKQQATNHELIKQIQDLSNENKHLKNEDLTASDYVAPATPSFTEDNEAQSTADKPIQYQEYRYSQQHKLDIGPQWGDVKPDLGKN